MSCASVMGKKAEALLKESNFTSFRLFAQQQQLQTILTCCFS
jgi:hypothetical protein